MTVSDYSNNPRKHERHRRCWLAHRSYSLLLIRELLHRSNSPTLRETGLGLSPSGISLAKAPSPRRRSKASGRAEALPLAGSHPRKLVWCYGRILRSERLSAAMSRLEKSSVSDTRCVPPSLWLTNA